MVLLETILDYPKNLLNMLEDFFIAAFCEQELDQFMIFSGSTPLINASIMGLVAMVVECGDLQ